MLSRRYSFRSQTSYQSSQLSQARELVSRRSSTPSAIPTLQSTQQPTIPPPTQVLNPAPEPEPEIEDETPEQQRKLSKARIPSDTEDDDTTSKQTLQNYPHFISNISQFYNQAALADVTLIVHDEKYHGHKFILAKSSEVFRKMLYEPMKADGSEIILDESVECQAVFDLFLRYLYTAEVTICTDTAVGILCLADKYKVTSLKELCTRYMVEHSKSPKVGNALQWYAWSKALQIPALFERCFECICWNFYDIILSENWLNMDLEFVKDFLTSNRLVIPDEFTLFEYVANWLMHAKNVEKFKENAATILPLIRFPQMLVPQLNKIEHNEIRKTECGELIMELINKAYRFRALCPNQTDLGLNFSDAFYQPRDYCDQIVDTQRMANSLRFGIQVDVKMFVGPVPKPREERIGDWKITYRKNGDVWSLQIYCHESAMVQNEARFQASVMVSNEAEKVIQVQRAQEFVCSRGSHQNVQITIDDPVTARFMAVIIKPVAH